MKTYTINVTQKDIDNGIQSRPDSCPVALACQRKLKKEDVTVGALFINNLDKKGKNTPQPKSVQNFVCRFDDGKKVKPFKFQIKF